MIYVDKLRFRKLCILAALLIIGFVGVNYVNYQKQENDSNGNFLDGSGNVNPLKWKAHILKMDITYYN